MVLDREAQFWRRLIEAPAEKMRGADYSERVWRRDALLVRHDRPAEGDPATLA